MIVVAYTSIKLLEDIGKLIGSPNQVEAVMSYFEKRPPQFADPT